MKDSELRIASLISGTGSTMERIAIECIQGSLKDKAMLVAVFTDRFTSGIHKATTLGIKGFIIDKNHFKSNEEWGEKITKEMQELGVDIILQNGWLSKTPETIIQSFEGRIFNQHPAPLDPDNKDINNNPLHFGGNGMYGLNAHAAVLKFQELSGRKFPTEATIHQVTPNYDEGAVVYREEMQIRSDDTPFTLAKRLLNYEHKAQILFLNKFRDGKIQILKRNEPLIKKGEEQMLYLAKELAINNLPSK